MVTEKDEYSTQAVAILPSLYALDMYLLQP